ncbi:MAG TPA: DUF86 domain-containing protein [Bacteroidota bacterium]|nr:DUF86 domain-containing protein [Bacteroidota bacterium]
MQKITDYIGSMDQQEFAKSALTTDAVVRNLEVIGEAAPRIPETFKAHHPEVPWRRVVGLRNRIVHEYFGVDLGIVWSVVTEDLPPLKSEILGIIESLKKDSEAGC